MDLKVKFSLEENEKLTERFSPEFIELVSRARKSAIECGSKYISTIHFFIADCEIANEGSIYHLFYTDRLAFEQFKESYAISMNSPGDREDEYLYLEDESEYSIADANELRITNKQSLIYPCHFFIATLTQRFTETRFFLSVKKNLDIVDRVTEYYTNKGLFKLSPISWEERNKHFIGPGLNESVLTSGNLPNLSISGIATEARLYDGGINTDAIYSLKHYFDLLLLNNLVAKSSTKHPDITITSDQDFWTKSINGLLYPGQIVQLLDFKLFEWMATSPGITYSSYHKNFAAEKKKRFEDKLDSRPRDLRKIITDDDDGHDRFIEAGISAIRLAPKTIHNELQHMVTATSEKSPTTGIPVTMNTSYYSELIGQMKSGEKVYVNIIGRLMVLPSELSAIRIKYERTVPKFYVEVFEIRKLSGSNRKGTLVGPAISVSITYAKRDNYSGLVTFDRISESFDDKPGEIQRTVERLTESAIKQSGEASPVIIGDFDEFFDHFENVEFPIKDMANGRFSATKLLLYRDILGIHINELYMGDKNVVNNSVVGAIGSNAVSSGNVFNQMNAAPITELDYDVLKQELAKLRGELTTEAKTPEEYRAVGLVASAEIAASEKDQSKVLAFLKESGKWVLDTATKIGVSVVSEILKKQF